MDVEIINTGKDEKQLKMKRYIGNNYQIGGTRHYRLSEGFSDGCRCIDVRTGSGFEYTVVCDRGLDISLASYKGINLPYLTENMEANPSFCDPWETEWLRTFSAGLLTTCGPAYLSSPCSDEGERLGQHGRWSGIPAKRVADLTDFESGDIIIEGDLFDSAPFSHKLHIHRTIKSKFGESWLLVKDKIKNEGSRPVPLNLLYHINFGYPFLNENSKIYVPSVNCCGYDEYTQKRMDERNSVKSPNGENYEKNYLHTFDKKDSLVTAWVHNKDIDGGMAVYITFDSKKLPFMTQWVLEDVKDYVLALEPANVPCESRDVLRARQQLPFLNPGETLDFGFKTGVVSGNDNITYLINSRTVL